MIKTNELSGEAILELEGALARASPGPWRECGHDRGGCQCGLVWSMPQDFMLATFHEETDDGKLPREMMQANAALCAALRNAAPSLLSEIRQARLFRKEARKLLELCLSWFAEEADHGQGDAWLMRDRLVAFLGERSDREQSEPPESTSEGNPVAAPTKGGVNERIRQG